MPNIAAHFPSFAQRLRGLRRAKGLKQSALAQDLCIDQTTVSRWEAGRQMPTADMQARALKLLTDATADDAALRRLVENAGNYVHLVEEASHICLAYSKPRATDWRASQSDLLGVSLWQFATDEIRQAEAELADSNWWSERMPASKSFRTSGLRHEKINISEGGILWERLYLADGTPARLVTGW